MGNLFNIFSESLYRYVFLQVDAWGLCTGMTLRVGRGSDGGGGSGWGTRVHPWQIHVDVWQNQYNIVK